MYMYTYIEIKYRIIILKICHGNSQRAAYPAANASITRKISNAAEIGNNKSFSAVIVRLERLPFETNIDVSSRMHNSCFESAVSRTRMPRDDDSIRCAVRLLSMLMSIPILCFVGLLRILQVYISAHALRTGQRPFQICAGVFGFLFILTNT